MDAIARLDLAEAERTALNNNIPVAFAVTYLVGVIGAAWVLSQLAPKLMRIDLAEECRKLEEEMQGGEVARSRPRGASSNCAPTPSIRARAASGARVADLEASGGRAGLRRAGAQPRPDRRDAATSITCCEPGTSWRSPGARTTLVEVLEAPGSGLREVDDRDLLDVPSDVVDVVVTNKDIDGRTLADLGAGRGVARRVPAAHHAGRHRRSACCPTRSCTAATC